MSHRIHDLPEHDRPRERLMREGPGALSDAELLGIFINTGMKGENAVQIGARLLAELGGLRRLSRLSPQELARVKGLGPAKASTLRAVFELGKRAEHETLKEVVLTTAADTYRFLCKEMHTLPTEEVHVLLLNARQGLIHRERLFKGGLTAATCSPREIIRVALNHQAAFIVIAHNHPSGDPSPSTADRAVTRHLQDACALMEMPLIDHVIVGYPTEGRERPYFSFADAGLIK